jgi:hypothetical protein
MVMDLGVRYLWNITTLCSVDTAKVKRKKKNSAFFFHSFFVSLDSLAIVNAQGLRPLIGLYVGPLSDWWRHFSQLDVLEIFITPFFGWGPCASPGVMKVMSLYSFSIRFPSFTQLMHSRTQNSNPFIYLECAILDE